MSPRLLAVLVLTWTALSWGGRLGLLTGAELRDPRSTARIAGSILLGLAVAVLLWQAPGRAPWLRWLFAGWTVLVWLRGLAVTWLERPSLAFALVHTALAVGWLALAWLVAAGTGRGHDGRDRGRATATTRT